MPMTIESRHQNIITPMITDSRFSAFKVWANDGLKYSMEILSPDSISLAAIRRTHNGVTFTANKTLYSEDAINKLQLRRKGCRIAWRPTQ